MSNYHEYQQRVVIESGELSEKIDKLMAFFQTDTFQNLPEIDKVLLRMQIKFMEGYSVVLKQRISGF